MHISFILNIFCANTAFNFETHDKSLKCGKFVFHFVLVPVADPGFPIGEGANLFPMHPHFEKFICQNEGIGTFRGRAGCAPVGCANEYETKLAWRF